MPQLEQLLRSRNLFGYGSGGAGSLRYKRLYLERPLLLNHPMAEGGR